MGGRRSRGKRRAPVEPSVEVGDEIDEFVSRREEVRLGGRDLDEEQSEEEVDETPVMGLEGEDGSEEDDDDDDDEGEDEAWKKKKLYYGGDNVDYNLMSSDEEDALEEEEQEALRLQSREAEELEEEDFAGQDVGEHTEESAAKLDKRQDDKDNIHEQATVMESVRKALGTVSDDEDEDESNTKREFDRGLQERRHPEVCQPFPKLKSSQSWRKISRTHRAPCGARAVRPGTSQSLRKEGQVVPTGGPVSACPH
uniref:Uncharacterized protein n=1 Tax=Rhodosorus marinus TaxID=101924 RepID=A0A7S2ZAY4_9RHOD|mmetsp:Transcript_1288/g.3804  ORF Transcript_1288/g.3804 Transcript_1288/m.3804 type:complete len:254 (+) Transcript_1288:139-900(+)